MALRKGDLITILLVGAIWGLTIAKLLIEAGRRRHDMGASLVSGLLWLVAGMIVVGMSAVLGLTTGELWMLYAAMTLYAGLWIALLFRKGTRKPSVFGAAPLAWRPSFARDKAVGSTGGPILTIILTVTGAGLGYGAARWLDGLVEQRAHDAQLSVRQEAVPDNGESLDDLERAHEGQQR